MWRSSVAMRMAAIEPTRHRLEQAPVGADTPGWIVTAPDGVRARFDARGLLAAIVVAHDHRFAIGAVKQHVAHVLAQIRKRRAQIEAEVLGQTIERLGVIRRA